MRKYLKILIAVMAALVIVAGVVGYNIYRKYLAANVTQPGAVVYVPTGTNVEGLLANFDSTKRFKDLARFKEAAQSMKLAGHIKPGKYVFKAGMGNRAIINMLKAGNQVPVSLVIQNFRTRQSLAKYLGKNLEPDSASFNSFLSSDSAAKALGFTSDNFYNIFIPGKYDFYWTTTPSAFVKHMFKEYKIFWNTSRVNKANAIGLSPQEVQILASIVDAEALHDNEMPTIAGLYINRLKKGIKLQADPTVIFAANDFTVKRVTNRLLLTPSPYNTYLHEGLPPGPVSMPSVAAIDAVLNYQPNNYLYMCARADFSGYHAFAADKAQHEINAKAWRDALNARKIFR